MAPVLSVVLWLASQAAALPCRPPDGFVGEMRLSREELLRAGFRCRDGVLVHVDSPSDAARSRDRLWRVANGLLRVEDSKPRGMLHIVHTLTLPDEFRPPAGAAVQTAPAAASPRVAAESSPLRSHLARLRAARDGTEGLMAALLRREGGMPLPAPARDYCFLLIRGIAPRSDRDLPLPAAEALRRHGYCVEVFDAGPNDMEFEATRPFLARSLSELATAGKPIVVLAHSKGAVNILELLKLEPALGGGVAAVVAIQAPYFGSQTAEQYLQIPGAVLDGANRFDLAPTQRALQQVSRKERAGAGPPVLPAHVRLFSVGTTIAPRSADSGMFLRANVDRMLAATGQRNDGRVEVESAVIPGSCFAVVEGIAHVGTILDGPAKADYNALSQQPGYAETFGLALIDWALSGSCPDS